MSTVTKSAKRPKSTTTSRPELTGWQIVSGSEIVLPFVPTKERAEKCVGIFNDAVTTGWQPKGQRRRRPLAKMRPVEIPDTTAPHLEIAQVIVIDAEGNERVVKTAELDTCKNFKVGFDKAAGSCDGLRTEIRKLLVPSLAKEVARG